ncbi:DNRLRE domain-containing protein [Nonomuraea pusilla]|uniref:DNRLRE domain-containing protein n=1 Tax=Nonomuraea pusilla TaxID=46177 RepID=UPI0033296A9E
MLISLAAVPSWAQEPTAPAPQSPGETSKTPPPSVGAPTGDRVLETAKAKAAKSGKRVEIPERHTETTTLYANPDGKTLRLELNTQPVRVKNADGKGFTPIDTTLVEGAGTIKPKAIVGTLTLSDGQDKTLLKSQASDATSKITMPSVLPKPTLKANTATYADAYGKGRDLLVAATPSGFQQKIVIRERPTGPVSFPVPLELPSGMSFKKNAAGLPTIVGKDGRTLTEVRPTLMQDAKAADVNAPLDTGKAGKAAVTLADDGKTLVFTPDAEFLADPETTYPVTVTAARDDWYEEHTGWQKGGMDTWINDVDYQDSWDTQAQPQIVVGKSYASSIAKRWRGYLKFPDISPDFAGSRVQNADLHLWNYQSNECGEFVGSGITARRITSAWDDLTLHWSSQPSVTGVGADTEYGAYSEDCSYAWNLTHSLDETAQAWVDGATNYGIQLTSGNESELRSWRRYTSHNAGGCMTAPLEDCKFQLHPPILTIDFELPASPPEVIVYSYEGPRRATQPTYEEAVAMRVDTPGDIPDLPPMSAADEQALAAHPNHVAEISPAELEPFTGESGEESWDGGTVEEGSPADTTPPTVTSTVPAAEAREAPVDTSLKATFDEPVWDPAFSLKDADGTAVEGTVSVDSSDKVFTFTPSQPLKAGTTYIAEISEANDASANTMSSFQWSFQTQGGARWSFDEGSGNTAADAFGRHPATLSDTAAWIAGKSGQAVSNLPSQAHVVASQAATKQGRAVEVAEETTATSITYAQPDGKTFRTEVTTGPVRTRQGDGWVPIDTTLTEQGGKLRPKAIVEGAAVEISAGGTDAFVKLSADGKSYALRWPTPLPKPTVKGSVAIYTDAAGVGADLVVTALPIGFRHDVVLRQRPSKPLELRVGVEDDGLTLSEGKGGRLLLKDKDKKLVASAPQPLMWDGSAKGRLPLAKSAKVDTEVIAKDGRTELVLKPDHAFLTAPDTTYPVRVDPTTILPLTTDIEVPSDSTADSPADQTYSYMMAGTRTGGLKYRVHLKFDTSSLTGSTVTDAKLSMNTIDAQACSPTAGNGIQVARLTSAWDPANLYWANKPTLTTEDASTNTKGVNQDCATWPDKMEWNVTGIAQDWASGAANHGVVLKSPGETNVSDYRVFTSAENTDSFGVPPMLTVTSSGPVSAPTVSGLAVAPAQIVDGTTVTGSLTPQLAATVADAIGGSLTGEFEVEHDPAATQQGTGPIWTGSSAAVASGGRATADVPAGKLADGWKIRWRARAVNATAGTTSAWSGWQAATVDVPNPTVSAFQVTPSQVVNGITVATSVTPTLLATVTEPAAQPVRAEYEIEHDPAATQQGTGQIWAGAVDDVASGTQAGLTVPGGKLADGWKVRWRVRAVNTVTTVGSPWSDWQALTMDVPDPVSEPSVGALQVSPSQQVDGITVTPTLTPGLSVQVSDPSGGALRAEVEVEHDPAAPAGQGSGTIWTGSADSVPADTQATITVPADKLADAWKVRWRARAVSAASASAWSDWQFFTVTLPKPTVTGLVVTPSTVVDGVTVTTKLTPSLQATLIDPAGETLRAEAQIEHDPDATGQGSGQIWAGAVDDVASGTQASIAVPAGTLTDGWKVRWRLRAVGKQASSAWSDWQSVTVDVTQPGEEPLARTAGPVIRTDQSFTAAAWLRWADKDGDYVVLEQKGAHQAPFRLGNTAQDGLVFTLTSADTADATVEGVLSDIEPPINEWFHLAGVYDAGARTASLYLNGNLVKTEPLSLTGWHAPQPLTLGTSMRGDLDEARTYQRALTANEVGALAAAPAAPTPTATAAIDEPAAVDEPSPYEVEYRHFTLDTCRTKAPKEAIWGIWTDATVFSGCSVRWFGISMWIDDFDPDTGTKKKVRLKLPDGSEGMDLMMRSTTVMNTYLGTRDGTGIRNPGSDGVTGPLTPQEFSMWIAFDEIDYDELTGIGNSRFKLSVTSKPDSSGSTCQKTVDGDREALVKDWNKTTRYFRFKSESPGKEIRRCTVFPMVNFKDLVTNVGPSTFPLWGKIKDDRQNGIWTPPTVRCDDESMGPGAPGNWPEEKRVRYTGACIFPDVSRIYRTDVDHVKRGPVAAHIWAAFNTPDATDPKKAPGQKVIPGNWDGKTSGTRAPLTRINENDLRPGDPKQRTWGQVQISERRKACRAAKVVGDCDEFPFNSVKEGPGWGDGNFSVRGVPSANNKSDGWYLSVFYARYRVLLPDGAKRPDGDRFWVSVKGTPSP